ncbi:uncharacterized protein N7443_002728 [Penicillium atrosanguineum]|uniref:uncharacterized protein n=1 Tax=Penicillium atrosanguineum TaxID=1132637 RepID=UPI002394AB38|nr:uncharacterized protein N7443_002728 [Penicillium atrosanguineum]KAJ5310267.1 hypothetical protein N7443_002728 [Penicillium atrosanguineum]
MDADESLHVIPAPLGKKRIPVRLSGTRGSESLQCMSALKVCIGKVLIQNLIYRCQKLEKQCVFFEIPKDPVAERIEGVESEVQHLRVQLDEIRQLLEQSRAHSAIDSRQTTPPQQHWEYQQQARRGSACTSSYSHHAPPQENAVTLTIVESNGYVNGQEYQRSLPELSPNGVSGQSAYEPSHADNSRSLKRKRSCFEIRGETVADFIDKGLITPECAYSCFNTFFQGCDRYIPIFDPEHDTFDSIRSRSSILLNAICTIGCMVETSHTFSLLAPGTGGPMSDMLHAELKKWINVIIQNKALNCLESVQAMLVVACYSADRLLILSFATRMALDLGLHEAFEEVTERLAMKNDGDIYSGPDHVFERERVLMRKSRTWFGLLVLEHIFRVDGGKPPGIRLIGNSRRCRILLSHPSSTILDLRLFSQVELNILRGKNNLFSWRRECRPNTFSATINDTLVVGTNLDRLAITDFVHEMKIDLDLWFDDWLRIIEGSISAQKEKPYLLVALRVQKCWAEMMLNCKALRTMGVENVAAMSSTERNILLAAKASARRHLRIITVEPDFYLAKLKYAMDFVWAKCAFSFLLLLKLSRLLPERDKEHQELLEHGNRLVDELSKAGSNTNQSRAGNIYLQILKVSIEKYGRALQESQQPSTGGSTATSPFWELFDAQADLQWFVPEQFVSEWDFPGLNLFYFPTAWQDFFGDFSLAM